MLDISSISSKIVYEEFLSRKVIPPTAQNKYKKEYPNLSVDWKKIYSLAFSVTLDTKLRAFQYKLLNHIVYTNDRLYKFKIVDSPLSAVCNSENESLEHLLFPCKASEVFWKEVLSWLAIHKNELLNVSLTDVLFGKFDIDKDFMVVNHVLLLEKYFIYRCKLDNIKPSLAVFKAKLKATLNLEFYIARKKGTLAQHYRKWNIDNFHFHSTILKTQQIYIVFFLRSLFFSKPVFLTFCLESWCLHCYVSVFFPLSIAYYTCICYYCNVHMFVVSNVRLVSIYFYCSSSSVSTVRTVSNV